MLQYAFQNLYYNLEMNLMNVLKVWQDIHLQLRFAALVCSGYISTVHTFVFGSYLPSLLIFQGCKTFADHRNKEKINIWWTRSVKRGKHARKHHQSLKPLYWWKTNINGTYEIHLDHKARDEEWGIRWWDASRWWRWGFLWYPDPNQ